MKKTTAVVLGIAAVMTAGGAAAASADSVSFKLGKNLFIAGNDITVSDDVEGDLYIAGRSVRIDGDVGGDLMFGALSVTVNSDVQGSVRGGAQSVNINGSVGESVVVGSSEVNVNEGSAATVNDVMIGSVVSYIGRPVTGDLAVGADSLRINKPIQGAATLKINTLAADDAATIAGNVTYYSAQSDDPILQRLEELAPSRVTYKALNTDTNTSGVSTTMRLVGILVGALSVVLIGWLMQVAASDVVKKLVSVQRTHYLLTLLMGLVFVPLVGMILVILVRLVAFMPAALAIGLALPLIVMVGTAAVYQNIGDMVRRGKMDRPYASILAGGIVVAAFSMIPFLGGIIAVVILLLAMGSLLTYLLNVTGLIKTAK